jgi:hypothetical protein
VCELFDCRDDDCHVIYKNLFINTDDEVERHVEYIRQSIAKMWDRFKPFADPDFKAEFCRQPDQRYWEMYLGNCLLDRGFDLVPKKTETGPDFCLKIGEKKIWVEATTVSSGQKDKPDHVPELVPLSKGGSAQAVPREKIILRYTNSLDEKERKFKGYLENKIVGQEDIKIIAISRGSLRGSSALDLNSFILSAVFSLGNDFVTYDCATGEIVRQGRHYQSAVKKANGVEIETLFFMDSAHSDISAVIHNSSDIANPPEERGVDLSIIHNPFAKNPLPRGSLKFLTEYYVEDVGNEWELKTIRGE